MAAPEERVGQRDIGWWVNTAGVWLGLAWAAIWLVVTIATPIDGRHEVAFGLLLYVVARLGLTQKS